ncbi:MAG: chromosome segregation protein SMC, partial [Mycobacteriales bacterium]
MRSRLAALEQRAEDAAPELARAQDRWFRAQQLRDKLTSTESLAAERVRLLTQDTADEQTTGRDPEELRAQAAEARAQEEALLAEVREAKAALEAAVAAREAAEQAYAAEQQRLQRLVRAAADRREGLAKLAGQVGARRSRIEAGEAEIGRLRGIAAQSQERAAAAEREFTGLEASVAVDEEGEEDLDSAYERAAAVLEQLDKEVERLREDERAAERDRTTAGARLEALELSLSRKDGAATLLAAADSRHGIVGSVAALLQVQGGHEAAVAAALGWAGDALVVESVGHAAEALTTLREQDAGRAAFLVGQSAVSSDPSTWPALDGSAVWARDVVQAPPSVCPAVEQLLDRVALVSDATVAADLVSQGHGVTAVTSDGDVFAPGFVRGGSSHAPSLIEIQSAVDETRERVAEATRRGEQARFALSAALERHTAAADEVEAALEALHESDAKMAAVAERLGQLGATARSAKAEVERT